MNTGLSRRRFLQVSAVTTAGAVLAGCATAPTATLNESPVTTPDEALARLMEGNQRYVGNKTVDPNQTSDRRVALTGEQHPFATIFSCVDSRVPPELVFDRGLGDLFVIRTAGQAVDNAVLGSLQFGVAELKIPLLVVMGHQSCGAVKATLEAVENGTTAPAQIGVLVEDIRPAIEATEGMEGDHLANAVDENVRLVVERLNHTPILQEAVAAGTLKIVGTRYDFGTGEVVVL
jgi:carbonic anhydrase